MEQLPKRFAQLAHARVAKTDRDLAGTFSDLWIGNAQQLTGVAFDPFGFHLPDERRGMAEIDLRLHGVAQFRSVFRDKFYTPLPAARARRQDFNRNIDRE